MTTSTHTVGHHQLRGNPQADWSHAASYLAGLYAQSLFDADSQSEDVTDLDQDFRRRLLKAGGVDQLTEEDRILAASLTEETGDDLSYWPGGDNYRVSTMSPDNPLGLPGDLWALVTEAEDGAVVEGLITPAGDGGLDIMVPGGRGWEPLLDMSVIEGYNFVGVNPEAADLYHKFDRDNTLGVISTYPLSPLGPFPTPDQAAVLMPFEIPPKRDASDEFWKNSGESYDGGIEPTDEAMMASAVVIESADDLPEAIAAAAEDPDIRWYVERRVAALGLEADLPWQEG